MMNYTTRRIAFTLAEVLITLAIIGIVAALTIPNLISNYKKNVTITQLKEAYAIMSNTYKLSVANNGDFLLYRKGKVKYSDDLSREEFDKYFRSYMKVLKECNTLIECGYDSENPFTTIHTGEIFDFVTKDHHRYYILANGMVLLYRDFSGGSAYFDSVFLSVDINGSKGPNILGVDLFQFSIIDDFEYVKPRLAEWDKEQVESECINGGFQGMACTAKIMNDGWQFADNYPYKF